jgi:hypothetical protein
VYYKHNGGNFLVITLYVDTMLFIRNNKDVICNLKSHTSTQFGMKDSRDAKYILVMEMMRDR